MREADAVKAIERLNKVRLHGLSLIVQWSKSSGRGNENNHDAKNSNLTENRRYRRSRSPSLQRKRHQRREINYFDKFDFSFEFPNEVDKDENDLNESGKRNYQNYPSRRRDSSSSLEPRYRPSKNN